MIEFLLSNPYTLLLWIVSAMLLTVSCIGLAGQMEIRIQRLPIATSWVDLDERVQRLRVEKVELEEKNSELRRLIGERDHVAGETAALEERRDAIKLELSALDDARREIDEVKRLAADVATELAYKQSELDKANSDILAAQSALEKLNEQIAERGIELERSSESLRDEVIRLTKELEQLRPEIDLMRSERGALLSARSEAAELSATKAIMQSEIDLRSDELDALYEEKDQVENELQINNQNLADLKYQITARSAKLDELNVEYENLKNQKTLIQADIQSIESDRNRLRGGSSGKMGFDESILDDLKILPKALETSHTPWKPDDEESALFEVKDYLLKLNLEYPDRVVRAFHTALKINDVAQLTVLAGVSGTGKSLLPRRYAEAMGIRFLPFAVEPRWDSPQDLLGFYNYIERRFKATDLARALVHLDPHNTSNLVQNGPHTDDMMIVLLDEMNLARVEYYFSEFLSRLEARPSWKPTLPQESMRDAMIPVEIQGQDSKPIRLYPPHNMLFVGTMNDDESTQALSDKVLDRGNIMQFAAPNTFASTNDVKIPNTPDRSLKFHTWRTWVRTPDKLSESQESKTKDVIRQLADVMNECGRPFGHRLNTAIRTYVANYPLRKSDMGDVSVPLSDQIEFRILPKLRGLSLDDHSQVFDKLKDLVGNELKDEDLKSRLDDLVGRQRSAGGLFNWRGITRR